MTTIELITLIAALVSIILGIVAIVLSILFYRFSQTSSAEIQKSATSIQGFVEKLEVIFNKFYGDTFSMMKETVGDMREHIWKAPTPFNTENDITEKIKQNIIDELPKIIKEQIMPGKSLEELNDKVSNVTSIVEKIIEQSVAESKKEDTEDEQIIINFLKENDDLGFDISLNNLTMHLKWPIDRIVNTLFEMRQKGILSWDGAMDYIKLGNVIYLENGKKIVKRTRFNPHK
jgi:hypothetical protein